MYHKNVVILLCSLHIGQALRLPRVISLDVLHSLPLCSISSNQQVFDEASTPYQKALRKSGHQYKLEHNDAQTTSGKSKNRKRNITWYNPPFNIDVAIKVGRTSSA